MRKKPIIFLFVLVLLGALTYVIARPPEQQNSLLSRSRRYPALSGRITPLGYQWNSDGSIVAERYNSNKRSHEVFRVDPEAAADTVLFLYIPPGSGYGFDDAGSLSPDGQWRITTQMKQFVISSLDGTKRFLVP